MDAADARDPTRVEGSATGQASARRMPPSSQEAALLDAAEELFYEEGYQAVGMDRLRTASGVPLKRIYGLFPGKEAVAVAMLDRRDARWRGALDTHVRRHEDPHRRVLAVYDWLEERLVGPGHRGCAWINAFGELGGTSEPVAEAVRRHKASFRRDLGVLVAEAGASTATADAIHLLAEGLLVTGGIVGDARAVARTAAEAREAADRLLQSTAAGSRIAGL
ncbi:TetR/AcrR family transcriptional regulator [Nesterenkonia sp. F]|uniref:TetR/AcrR family transcriptional regulator n=1 Tax=Nesterenkonia sp. F TaxID=795955 RepID=UPI000255D205|nr:TetR/AcrR family transcriptional regulator [Nesterenkonia sp. F]